MKRKMSLLGAAIAVICASCAVATEPTLAVKNVASGQRWPWNGKVDISCDLTGTGIVDLSLSATTNGVRVCDVVTLAGETTIDLNAAGGETNGVRFVWNAANDFAAAGLSGFHAENVRIEVVAERRPDPPSSGQLWKNGPVWAERNVGATAPEEPGFYFWWGDTVGYTNTGSGWISVADPSDSISFVSYNATAKQTYNQDNGLLKTNGWIGDSGNLVSTHDAATAHLGASWRMPTSDEIEELVTNCVWTAKKDGSTLVGYILTGKAPEYARNSIFLPLTGYGSNAATSSRGYGYFWSSTPDAEVPTSSWYLRIGSSDHKRDSTIRFNGLPVRAVQDPPSGTLPMTVTGSSAETTVDLRKRVALPTGSVEPAGVAYSDTAWGAAAQASVTIGWKNAGTVEQGEFASGLTGSGTAAGALPKKDGDYKLTHSAGSLASFVTFVVSGYPLGCEENPWKVGEARADDVTAFTNGAGVAYFRPMRGVVSDDGLRTIADALGGADFPARLIAADGSETNDLQMLIGSGGGSYGNVVSALAGDDSSYTLFETPGVPYLDWDDEKKEMTNALCGVGSFTVLRSWMSDIDAGRTYVVMGDVTNRSNRITTGCGSAEGPTRIILCDGASLTAKYGVRVMEDDALVICGQEKGTGRLTAIGDGLGGEQDGGCYAGIGGGWSGGDEENCGAMTINGGTIVAVGGERAAGIGGGDGGDGGTLTINGIFVIQASEDGTETNLVAQAAYAADHGARSVSLRPGVGLKIPAATTGYSYVVTNVTAAVEVPASPKDGTNVYAFAANDNYEVTYTLDSRYEWATAPKANPLTGTITADTELAEVTVKALTYTVSYDANGAAGTMATDTFIPTVPTNLTAVGFSAVGYEFAGWTTNGSDNVAYADQAQGVNFVGPGETLALKAKWTDTGVAVATFDALTNALVAATNQAASLPVTMTLTGTIAVPQDGVVTVYKGATLPAVTFAGTGIFDVSGIVPTLWNPVTVGEGLAAGDLARFDANGVSKPVYEAEGGRVVLHARGETEDFPWILDEANGVTAWVDEALTNLAAVVIDNGLAAATNAIDLVALTNGIATYGYEPALTPFNALLKDEYDDLKGYVKPVNWIGEQGDFRKTLADALAAGETVVIPNFVTEEIPEEIVETGKGADGKTYVAVVENVPPADGVDAPVRAIYAEGLLDLATNKKANVTLVVTPKTTVDEKLALTNTLLQALAVQEGHPMRYDEVNFVDLSVYFDRAQQTELDSLITIHIPWTIRPGITYGFVRWHNGAPLVVPEGAVNAVDNEYFEIVGDEIVVHIKKFSSAVLAGALPLTPCIGASIKWKLCYATGSLFAQLKLSVTNGQASAVQNLKFVFEDRDDGSKLWGASADRTKMGAVLSGWPGLPAGTWRYVNIDGAALTTVQGGGLCTFGVQSGIDTANGTVASADRKIELYKKNAVISAAEANTFLGWVVWEAYGDKFCAPVGENAAAVNAVLSGVLTANLLSASASLLPAPLTVDEVNRALAYGSAYLMDGSDPSCRIVTFQVGGGTIRGRIALEGAGGQANAPGENVKATLYGASTLDAGFKPIEVIPLAEDGTFATAIPAGKAFFRIRLEVVNVVK